MAGSDTDAAVRGLSGELSSASEILGRDSASLFDRVHDSHQKVARVWKGKN